MAMDVVILSAARTPTGRFGGRLRTCTAAQLGADAARAALERAGVRPEQVGACIFGNARQAGGGPNPARQIGRRSGLADAVPAFTVNQACASGLKAVELACQEIALGGQECILAGGAEAMSRIPFLAEDVRWGARMGHKPLVDAMFRDGYRCPLAEMVMGETADLLAREYGISRSEQDEYALRSQRRAAAARADFAAEIAPVELASGANGAPERLAEDEPPRATDLGQLARLPPVFSTEGTVTAGNASSIADGAAALVLGSARFAERQGLTPLAKVLGFASAGVDPRRMGLGPVPATRRLLENLRRRIEDFDGVELNEAFAAQVLACQRDLPFAADKLNVRGGAIALGHPTGCSGARILVTLLHSLRKGGGGLGLATLCASGGLGLAAAIEVIG